VELHHLDGHDPTFGPIRLCSRCDRAASDARSEVNRLPGGGLDVKVKSGYGPLDFPAETGAIRWDSPSGLRAS